jgi:hypothetical protein
MKAKILPFIRSAAKVDQRSNSTIGAWNPDGGLHELSVSESPTLKVWFIRKGVVLMAEFKFLGDELIRGD